MDNAVGEVELIVAVASWEPRFLLGMTRILERYSTKRLLMYFMREYHTRTANARAEVRSILAGYPAISLEEREISFEEPENTWRRLEESVGPGANVEGGVLVDLTTMPREVIWGTLFWLEAASTQVEYIYNRPAAYADDWLARDPNDPRFVYKLAGTLEIDRPTALVAVTGFDENRCRQAVEFYEPIRVLLATQRGEQYNNDRRNVGLTFDTGGITIERSAVDAYGNDHGYEALREHVSELSRRHNVILCSFGPKPSAIALYRLQREFAQTALAYIGCKEYNPEYSCGLGEPIVGSIVWPGSAREQ